MREERAGVCMRAELGVCMREERAGVCMRAELGVCMRKERAWGVHEGREGWGSV
jgi:hypothetical protein